MCDFPSERFRETYDFIKWASENWKFLIDFYKLQYNPEEPSEEFLEASIQMIETFREENYHICIIMYLMQNMSLLSNVACTAFFKTATWLVDEKRVNYFENNVIWELKAQLELKKAKTNGVEK